MCDEVCECCEMDICKCKNEQNKTLRQKLDDLNGEIEYKNCSIIKDDQNMHLHCNKNIENHYALIEIVHKELLELGWKDELNKIESYTNHICYEMTLINY